MLSFYTVDISYCDFLREKDALVSINYDKKVRRPYIGMLFEVNSRQYYVPISSPKAKHKKMKNNIDFLKLNNGYYGAINFNNMIPVPMCCVHKIDIKNETDKKYKNLLMKQLTWCNKNEEKITQKAKKLYFLFVNDELPNNLKRRCCNFLLDEIRMDEYIENQQSK